MFHLQAYHGCAGNQRTACKVYFSLLATSHSGWKSAGQVWGAWEQALTATPLHHSRAIREEANHSVCYFSAFNWSRTMSSCRGYLGKSEYKALSCGRLLIELLIIYSAVDPMVTHFNLWQGRATRYHASGVAWHRPFVCNWGKVCKVRDATLKYRKLNKNAAKLNCKNPSVALLFRNKQVIHLTRVTLDLQHFTVNTSKKFSSLFCVCVSRHPTAPLHAKDWGH